MFFVIDGLKIFYSITDFEVWKQAVNIELFTPTDLDTGETKGKTRTINGSMQHTITHRGKYETYQLTIKETTKIQISGKRSVSYFLVIDGSLHKNYFGAANYLPFHWDHLQTEIVKLDTGLHLSGNADIVNLEIGLNIPLQVPVFAFLKRNLIAYKGHQFNRYNPDKGGLCLGYVCPLSHYSVKIYDKGKQFDLPYNLMRFELRFLKMQTLNERGIKQLSDLTDFERVNDLLSLLISAWDNILLYDSSINLSNPEIKPRDCELLKEGRRPGYWEQLKETNTRQFKYKRQKFRELVTRYGSKWHEKISELIKSEWENLFKNCPILPSVQNSKLSEFTVKVKGKNGQKRVCPSCGRDISNQDSRSKFCSAKFVGEAAAHRCRNRDSNPRNGFKAKIRRITGRGLLFDIKPYLIVNNKKIQEYGI